MSERSFSAISSRAPRITRSSRPTSSGGSRQWNTGAERLMGWTEAEFIGQSADIIFTPEDRERGQPGEGGREGPRRGPGGEQAMAPEKDGSPLLGRRLHVPAQGRRRATRGASSRSSGTGRPSSRRRGPRGGRPPQGRIPRDARPRAANPLSAIGNASQLSLRPDADAETVAWSKEVIARQVKNLSHMIDDLLDISRINRGKIQLRKEPLHVGPIITRAVESVSPPHRGEES